LPFRPGGLCDVAWFSAGGAPINWNGDDRSLMCVLAAVPRADPLGPPNHHVLTMMHNGVDPRSFVIPIQARHLPWRIFVNTAADSPEDIYPGYDGPSAPADGRVFLEGRSCMVFLASDA
jgi:glycogen operon protein